MGEATGISWTDHTFNCWWGCVKVSPACAICYAERDAKRYGHNVWGLNARRRFFGEKHWAEPLKWNTAASRDGVRRRVFCASMADVFEVLPAGHPDTEQMTHARERLFRHLIPATPQLDWLILTKRTDVMMRYFATDGAPLHPNIVAMTTAENQEWFDKRIGQLLATRALRRGLSLEPLLGAIDPWPYLSLQSCVDCYQTQSEQDMAACEFCGSKRLHSAISWIITGGESGAKARPTHPQWVRDLRDAAQRAGIPFHHKQNGEWVLESDNVPDNGALLRVDLAGKLHAIEGDAPSGAVYMRRVGKKAAGRLVDGVEWNEFPQPLTTERHANAEKATAITEPARPGSVPTTDHGDVPSIGSSTIPDSSPTRDGEAAANVGAAAASGAEVQRA